MSQFWIDIYSAAGERQNAHTQAVSNVRITEKINQIGECEFTLPAVVATELGSAAGLKYRLYHETQGDLGEFTHVDMTLDADQRTATIRAYNQLIELANSIIGFGKAYDGTYDLAFILSDALGGILNTVSFDCVFEPNFDFADRPAAMEFRGESVLRGMDIIRQYYRGYFRLESENTLLFGDFHSQEVTDSVTPVARLFGPVLNTPDTSDYAVITSLKRERKGSNIVNRVYPLGSGIGETQIDLRYSTRTAIEPAGPNVPSYTITVDPIGNAEDAYYIQDNESILQYGLIEAVLPFTEVRPITNSAADLENAANALYDLGVAFIRQHRAEQDIYSLSCVNLPLTVKPGDPIRVDYAGVAQLETGTTAFLTLTGQIFFVTQITRSYGPSGAPVADLVISRSGDDIVGSTHVLTSVISDIQRLKLRVQPTMTYYTKSSPTLPIDSTRFVDFTFYIGSEVLAINEMKVEFRLMPLRSFANNVSTAASTVGSTTSGGGSTPTSSSGGGSTVSSASGGGTTVTSGNTSVDTFHTHTIPVVAGIAGTQVYYSGGFFYTSGGGTVLSNTNGVNHQHSVTIGSHTHDVTIPSHTHNVTISSHTHDITIPSHTHSLAFGVTDDTQTPQTVTVKVNNTAVGDIINAATGVVIGSSVSGAGLYLVDILSVITSSDFRNRTHTIRFECGSQQGQVYAQLLSRVTIQPIAV
jgi:hypothetical protein